MEEFIAVIVLYNCELTRSETYQTLLASAINSGQSIDVIIYDNSPAPVTFIDPAQAALKLTYISDPDNGGVSAAYNAAAKIASERSKAWMLILDQDTTLPAPILQQYFDAITANPAYRLFAPIIISTRDTIISPCRFLYNKGYSSKDRSVGVRSLKNQSLINCGICISLSAFNKLNGFDLGFKLDYSDHDFISRFKKYISSEVYIIDAEVKHSLSVFEHNSLDTDMRRFAYFNNALLRYGSIHGGKLFSIFIVILRCAKLSRAHKSFDFIKALKVY
jgi:GT2 family glycosyltransferase